MAAKKPTKKTTSTGSPTLDAANAAKKFKAPKDYKPMTTAQKVAMAASLVGPGKIVKGAKTVKGLVTGTEKTVSQIKRARMLTGPGKDSVYALPKGAGSRVAVKAVPKKNTAKEADRIAKNSVKVLKQRTASGPGLETRGAKLTRAERAERAQDYQFNKSLGKYYSNQDRIAGTHPSELVKGPRGEGSKSLRKSNAVKKEAKPVIKINSKKSK